ncbi:MAG: nuclear transport factor 2 family protein [Thermoleophilaceae bacterium]
MSQENVEVVRQLIAALNERDVDRYLSLCTAEIEIGNPGTPLEGPTRGPEGVREYFARIEEASTTFRVEVERIHTVGRDRVLVFGQLKVVTSGGAAFDQLITNVYELIAGKLHRVDVYFDREEALEAAGLRE